MIQLTAGGDILSRTQANEKAQAGDLENDFYFQQAKLQVPTDNASEYAPLATGIRV